MCAAPTVARIRWRAVSSCAFDGETSKSGANLGKSQGARNWRARAVHARRRRFHDRSAGDFRPPRAHRNRDRRGQGRIHYRARSRVSRARLYRGRTLRDDYARAGRAMRPRGTRQSPRRADGRAHPGQPDAAGRECQRVPHLLSGPVAQGAAHQTSAVHADARREPVSHRRARARPPTSRPTCAIMRPRFSRCWRRRGSSAQSRPRPVRSGPGSHASTSRRAKRFFRPHSAGRASPKVPESAAYCRYAPNPGIARGLQCPTALFNLFATLR